MANRSDPLVAAVQTAAYLNTVAIGRMHEQLACPIPQAARVYGITGGEMHSHVLLDRDVEEAEDIGMLNLTAINRRYKPRPCFLVKQGRPSRPTHRISLP